MESFISEFREALTDTVYPIVQADEATAKEKVDIREGIVTVVEGIPPIRRAFEQTWLKGTNLNNFDDEDDGFDA